MKYERMDNTTNLLAVTGHLTSHLQLALSAHTQLSHLRFVGDGSQ
jgi:hypothetical protein